ncbi:MAG: hypothetical protein GY778_25835 [bacterium]|nr:hypothetical protein [bacterium]
MPLAALAASSIQTAVSAEEDAPAPGAERLVSDRPTGSRAGRHPFHDPGLSAKQVKKLVHQLGPIMALSEQQVVALVPNQTSVSIGACPNCSGGVTEPGRFTWAIDAPDRITCRFCKTAYPNRRFPMDRMDTVRNPLGRSVTVRYHQSAGGQRHYFAGLIRHYRREWLIDQASALAQVYHATRQAKYARRAALILDRFAQVYPGYCVVRVGRGPDGNKQVRFTDRTEPPGYRWFRFSEEVPGTLPLAYDLIYNSRELDRLSQELGADVRSRIEGFFRQAAEYAKPFLVKPESWRSNLAGYGFLGLVRIGRCLGEPSYIHLAHEWIQNALENGFHYDGMWPEGPSYHRQTVRQIERIVADLTGYSDPPGFRTAGGSRFDDLEPARTIPFLSTVRAAPNVLTFPDGTDCPVHDTWAVTGRKKKRVAPPRDAGDSRILPGFGHAVLAGGPGGYPVEAPPAFSGGPHLPPPAATPHVTLFASGREMISDIGYTHTKLRGWTWHAVGHNLVAIDRRNQVTRIKDPTKESSAGNLLMFVPDLGGLSVIEASGRRGFPGLASIYRRLLILVSVDPDHPYVIDVFHVRGGSVHDWLMHGSADEDQRAVSSLELTPRPGTLLEPGQRWIEPTGESSLVDPYGLMRNVQAGRSADGASVLFLYTDGSGLGTRVDLLGGAETELFLCQSPSVRRAKEDNRKVYRHLMPQIVARRRGTSPLESVFVSVIEPFQGRPGITAVQGLKVQASAGRALGLRVQTADRSDTLLLALGDATDAVVQQSRDSDGLTLHGRLGLVSETNGQPARAFLIGGTDLAKGALHLQAPVAAYEGTIEAATRRADGAPSDALLTSASLPTGSALSESWMIVTHGDGHTHGYEIDRVTTDPDGRRRIHLRHDHGLRISGRRTEECYFPRRTFEGTNRFRIYTTQSR